MLSRIGPIDIRDAKGSIAEVERKANIKKFNTWRVSLGMKRVRNLPVDWESQINKGDIWIDPLVDE